MESFRRRIPGKGVERLDLLVLAAMATLALLQAHRVFVPYLVFEIDQSERTRLATNALVVFGLTFGGALLFRLAGPRITLAVAVALLVIGRLSIQFSENPGIRWRLAAAAVIACCWLLIVVLPQGGTQVPLGVGFAFALDLLARGVRDTLDLPWMPGIGSHLTTIVMVIVLVLAAFRCASSGKIADSEASLVPSARFIGFGSALALWLVAAGNPGFAELRSELGLAGSFALLAAGAVLALWLEVAAPARWAAVREGRAFGLAVGLLGMLAIATWAYSERRWLELIMTPVMAFAVTGLAMRTVTGPTETTTPGRWRCGATLTIGLLLQTAFVFLYFARSGPIELLLAPMIVLTLSTLAVERSAPVSRPERRMLAFGAAATTIALALTIPVLGAGGDSSSSAADSSSVRVMTFNIQEGFSNENIWSLEETARTIEAHDPDIVVLQEITRGWLVMSSTDQVHWLADRLGMELAYSGNSHDELWGNAILTRLPIVSTDSVIYTTTDNLRRGAVAVEVETENGNLVVIDTHLDNPKGATEVRVQQIQELLAFWDGVTPAVIAGDFNADPGSPEWQAIIDAGLVDSGDGSSETTSEDERRIDYIFVTPDLQVDEYTVPDVWLSDHRPVVVELSPLP
ncbi:MAG: endonuclease/exonuclease/phosphatase family protein [Thermomicrobiales bacterium]